MNWQHFQTYNEASTRAFEIMCNQLFELWCKRTYPNSIKSFAVINGSGGDGGVESVAIKSDDTIIGLQAKWFVNSISTSQFNQIENSINTALKVRPLIKKYIVCIPRDLASDRLGRNGQVTSANESTRWQNMKIKLEEENPGLEIELWDEARITIELMDIAAAGIYRYWFEKSEISKDLIRYSFDKQKSGWLSQKYTADLHFKGIMQRNIIKFLGNLEERQDSKNRLSNLNQTYKKFIKACEDYIEFEKKYEPSNQLIQETQKFRDLVDIESNKIEDLIDAFINEQNISSLTNERIRETNFDILLNLLKENGKLDGSYFHLSEIKKSIAAVQALEIYRIISDISFQLDFNKYIILGNPGSGKTHGIANLVDTLLNEDLHIPILIHAKDIDPRNNWIEIISKTIGLSSVWNEIELWQAFESLSHRIEVNNAKDFDENEVKIIPKILICIEGIDESIPYNFWYDRLREIDAICSRYPRLRFCVTSRPYVFNGLPKSDKLLSNKLILPTDGDVPVNELFDEYLKYFNVNINECNWLKWVLKTPLSLRVFCENHINENISNIDKYSLTITRVLSDKIRKLDNEFNSKFESGYSEKDNIILLSLTRIAKRFLEITKINRNELIELLNDIPGVMLSSDNSRRIIDFLDNYGILHSVTINPTSISETSNTYYHIGIQPYFDYIIALLVVGNISSPLELKLIDTIGQYKGALQMLSILLLEDFNCLINEIHNISEYVSSDDLFDLVSFSLTNVSSETSIKYKKYVLETMKIDSEHLNRIANSIVLEVSRIDNHPLGPQMLHDYLINFESAGKRDLIWSIPCFLKSEQDVIWKCYTKIDLLNDRNKLINEDKHNTLPLVFVWRLTTVNQVERASLRQELMKWAILQPMEFYKLFELTINTNDPQMKEDLFAIAMGTVFMVEKDNPCIKLFGEWIIDNIFSLDKISENYDSAIRYYSRAIIERAYTCKYVSYKELKLSHPPYKSKITLKLNKEAIKGNIMSGYGPIDYDLSRYVLCEPINHMFFSESNNNKYTDSDIYFDNFSEKEIGELLKNNNNLKTNCQNNLQELLYEKNKIKKEYEKITNKFYQGIDTLIETQDDSSISNNNDSEIKDFLSIHSKTLELESLTSDQFILSFVYEYILQNGWNEEEFITRNCGVEKNKLFGVDSAIQYKYHPASHGNKSSVMTFCEKYTWCGRNELIGYLADHLTYKDIDGTESLISDYGMLDDFPNPAQDIFQNDPEKIMIETSWFLPEELSPLLDRDNGEVSLVNWIKDAPVPNFEKWIIDCSFDHEAIINSSKRWLALYSFNSISNVLGGVSHMWISSGIIKNEHFQYLIADIKKRKENIYRELMNPNDFHSYPDTRCYITPKEICWMDWKNEIESKIDFISINEGDFVNYSIEKNVIKCTADNPHFDDINYRLPSRKIREILNITDGDGYTYFNDDKHIESFFMNAGEKWYDSQTYLFANHDKLISQLDSDGYKIFWTVRLLREATAKAFERYPNLHDNNDRTWLVWLENGKLRSQMFLD